MVTTERKLTAGQVILLAADDLMATGMAEFSEWDLTVAAWARDRFRFGLRGYAQTYPDHKRVMMEIMGQKPHSPILLKLMEKLRPNTYRLTALGRTTAARFRGEGPKLTSKPVTVKELYDTATAFLNRPEFRRWQDNPEEPRDWTGAASFLGLGGKPISSTPTDPSDRLDEIHNAIRAALDWCNVQEAVFLTRGSGQGGAPIHVRDLAELLDFIQALKYRFPEHLEKKVPKAKKRIPD